MRNNRKIWLLAALSFAITISFTQLNCKKQDKEKSVRSSDDPKYVFNAAHYIDPDYNGTYGEMDYLAIGLAAIGGRVAYFDGREFKNRLIPNAYEGVLSTSILKDEMATADLQVPLSTNPTQIYKNGTYDNFFDALMGQAVSFSPQGNGNPTALGFPYVPGFEQAFTIRENVNSPQESFYTYLKLPFAPATYPTQQYITNWINLPICVIPDKDFESVLINGQPNPYLPIKGYTYGAGGLGYINFSSIDDIEAKQGVNYFIVIVGFDFSNSVPVESSTSCDLNICGDFFCAWDCNEDQNTCPDCTAPRHQLELVDVTLEKDVRVSCSGNSFEPMRENYLRGKYDISYDYYIYHCNGQGYGKQNVFYSKWKRKELIKEHQDCGGTVTQTPTGTRTTITKNHLLIQNFKPEGNSRSDDIYIMFYERDPRKNKKINCTFSNSGNTSSGFFNWKSCWGENPMGSKLPWSTDPLDDEPDVNGVWNHIVHIKGSQFTATSATTGEYHFNDVIGPKGGQYGVSFTLKYYPY